jgi:hypothetical protein
MTANQQYVPAEPSGPGPADISRKAAALEEDLSRTLRRTAEEIAHSECLDEEQRAEVYAILEALRSDTQTHRRLVGLWVSDKPRGSNA